MDVEEHIIKLSAQIARMEAKQDAHHEANQSRFDRIEDVVANHVQEDITVEKRVSSLEERNKKQMWVIVGASGVASLLVSISAAALKVFEVLSK